MFVDEVPVCDRCLNRPDTVIKLGQHAFVVSKSAKQSPPKTREGVPTGAISLDRPLDPASDFPARDPLKQLTTSGSLVSQLQPPQLDTKRRPPPWMRLLPSNVNSTVRPPTHSALQRRLTFPYFQSTRLSSPFSTPPEYALGTGDALALSTAVQGFSEEARRTSAPAALRPLRTSSAPTSRAIAEKRQRRQLPLHQTQRLPNFHDLLPSLHVAHEHEDPPKSLVTEIDTSKVKKRDSLSFRKSHRLRRTLQKHPSTRPESACGGRAHTAVPQQTITPAKPAFYKELSGFFATRAGKWILPSRVSETRESETPLVAPAFCSQCGVDVESVIAEQPNEGLSSVPGEALCESCREGGLSPADKP